MHAYYIHSSRAWWFPGPRTHADAWRAAGYDDEIEVVVHEGATPLDGASLLWHHDPDGPVVLDLRADHPGSEITLDLTRRLAEVCEHDGGTAPTVEEVRAVLDDLGITDATPCQRGWHAGDRLPA